MVHFDGHRNRIDRIVRPPQTEVLEQEIFGERLFDQDKSPWVKLVKMFLIYQNGEACVACPMTCTEGLVMLLDRYADTPETRRIRNIAVKASTEKWRSAPNTFRKSRAGRMCRRMYWRLFRKMACGACMAANSFAPPRMPTMW